MILLTIVTNLQYIYQKCHFNVYWIMEILYFLRTFSTEALDPHT